METPTNVRTTVGIMAVVILREHEMDLTQEEREHLEKVALEYANGEKNS